jgi:uncharacterized Zn finger protein
MTITFSNFKKTISSQVLSRGREYFQSGNIADLSFDEEQMLWEAQVIGTTQYDVSVLQAPNGSLACSCDCPYAEEDYCKHVAAVLYAIEDGYPEYIGGGAKKPAAKPAVKKAAPKAAVKKPAAKTAKAAPAKKPAAKAKKK